MTIEPKEVHSTLARTMLVEGYSLVLDLEKSHGQWISDALTGKKYLDFFTFYASRPVGFNHPKLREPDYLHKLLLAARAKPSNCDMYTTLYAEFADRFEKIALGPGMTHAFFVDGGALGVENALKAAFDWKARKNLAAGKEPKPGRVLHFTHAFHGRSGYTLSLTNTHDPRKTMYFPKFDWPRVPSPALRFPIDAQSLAATIQVENAALAEIDRSWVKNGEDIACIIIEPIQAEGGDRHFRPEFLRALRKICDDREALLVFDEVQTGMGGTGTMWMYEQIDVRPDLVAFAKKAQTGGMMAGKRLDEVDSVFKVKSRISSTFGGNLVDYTRCARYLEIIQSENLLANARTQGAYLMKGVDRLVNKHAPRLSAARGRGLLIAFDAPDTAMRDKIIDRCKDELFLVLPCGDRSVRLRPALDITTQDCDEALTRLEKALTTALA